MTCMNIPSISIYCINPFYSNVIFQYTLKTSENLLLSDVFRGDRNVILDENWLNSEGYKCDVGLKWVKFTT